jgi:plastocyanin
VEPKDNDISFQEGSNMRVFVTVSAVIALGLGVWGCGGSSYSNGNSGNSGNPVAPTPGTAGVVTINVVAVNGAQSFSPNPATLPAGQMVVWHNVDSITHRVVLNDRSVDTGDLAPGASSQPMPIAAGSGQYHCSIHPVMVGSVNRDTSTVATPCEGAYCN